MHIPILVTEVLHMLDIQPDDIVLDGTVGFGGHAQAICSKLGKKGIYIGLDQDPNAIQAASRISADEIAPNTAYKLILAQTNFRNFPIVLKKHGIASVTKCLLDLGMSSFHLDQSNKGFSFQRDEPLDMRMYSPADHLSDSKTAADILNTYSETELIHVFQTFGEFRHPERFVSEILRRRAHDKIQTTTELVGLIKKGFYFRNKRSLYINTCARVFQALRIEVNQELDALKEFLGYLKDYLAENGRAAILTFHSLEDKIVKDFVKNNKEWLTPLNKKVIKPAQSEIRKNSRSKSAKLRVIARQ
ncbi:16S rRNA (cytosine(1402)-N(4))-methyltransferase RsmH [Thermoproteota archaeon]